MLPASLEFLSSDRDVTEWMLADGGALDIERCPECWEKRAHIDRYLFACKVFRDAKVVDYGCGLGFGSWMLTQAGNTVVGIDTSLAALEIAVVRRPKEMHPFRLRFGTPGEFEIGPDFLGTVAFEVIEHMDDPEGFIQSVSTKHLVASVPVIPTVGTNPHHKRDYTIDSFFELMERRFDVAETWAQVQPFHGTASVIVMHGVRR
jgi:SAM-dependent methyltransferase